MSLAAVRRAARYLRPAGSEPDEQWCRRVMNESIRASIASLGPTRCSAVEISGELHRRAPWRTYETLRYPQFDLCTSEPPRRYDVVICEQVLEHVPDPWAAARKLRQLCEPGGHVIVSTPFLIRIHPEPRDFWRFSAAGLERLLSQADLEVESVATWGNRPCVRANLRAWVPYRPWHSLHDDARFPVVVWALARRSP